MKNIREQAKEYLALGWSVIPIKPGQKVPSVAWNEFRERYMTEEEVDKHFADDSNIAVVCGKLSGIMVIDQDFYKGDANLETFKGIDSPVKSITGRGGIHLYFKYKEGTQNTVNETVKADIRSEGGYVLIPPSQVDIGNGRTGKYAWMEEPTSEMLSNKLPEPPESLLKALYRTETTSEPSQASQQAKIDYSDLQGLSEGGRNNAISRTSLSLLSRGLTEDIAWTTIQGINAGFNPPLPEFELKATFESAVRKNRTSPSNSTFEEKRRHTANDVPQEISTTVSTRTTADDLADVIKQIQDGQVDGIHTGFKFLDDTMGGLIPGQSYLLFADTSVGKSMFAVNVLTHLAEQGVKSVYFDLENDMKMTMERIMFSLHNGDLTLDKYRSILREDPVDVEKLNDVYEPIKKYGDMFKLWDLNKLMERYGDITWPGVKQCIEEACVDPDVKVIVIDHLHYFSPAETDHAYLGEVARQINNLTAAKNVAILLVAHTKKGLLETSKKDDSVKAIRPTVDHIAGSAMIAKHFKNILALKRNTVANDLVDRTKTTLYVDKTKFGPAGSTEIYYCEQTLGFRGDLHDVIMVKASEDFMSEMRSQAEKSKVTLSAVNKAEEAKIVKETEIPEKKEESSVVEAPKPAYPKTDSYTERNAYKPETHSEIDDIPF